MGKADARNRARDRLRRESACPDPELFTMGHAIEALYREIGRQDARIVALETKRG